jgi:hypothetical protein
VAEALVVCMADGSFAVFLKSHWPPGQLLSVLQGAF